MRFEMAMDNLQKSLKRLGRRCYENEKPARYLNIKKSSQSLVYTPTRSKMWYRENKK